MAKKFFGIDIRGVLRLERGSSLPSFSSSNEARLFWNSSLERFYIQTASQWRRIVMNDGGSYDVIAAAESTRWANLNAPNADFTADVTSGRVPLTVQFTNTTTGNPAYLNFEWDFTNDGTVDSNDENPTTIYDTAGAYTVKLSVSAIGGSDTEIKTNYITVLEECGAEDQAFNTWSFMGQTVADVGPSPVWPVNRRYTFSSNSWTSRANNSHAALIGNFRFALNDGLFHFYFFYYIGTSSDFYVTPFFRGFNDLSNSYANKQVPPAPGSTVVTFATGMSDVLKAGRKYGFYNTLLITSVSPYFVERVTQEYDSLIDTWSIKIQNPSSLYRAAPAVARGDKDNVHIIGGEKGTTGLTNNDVYSSLTVTYSIATSLPDRRVASAHCSTNECSIFLCGGVREFIRFLPPSTFPVNTNLKYSQAVDSWSFEAIMNRNPHYNGAGAISSSGGGYLEQGGYKWIGVGIGSVLNYNDHRWFNYTTGTWSNRSISPSPSYISSQGYVGTEL